MLKEIFGYFVDEHGNLFNKHGRQIKFYENQKGYMITQIRVDGKNKTIAQHRLVAMAFIPNPDNKPEVDHKDGNRKHNHRSNLRWATREENVQHSYRYGKKTMVGSKNSRASLTDSEVHAICRMFSEGLTSPELSRFIGKSYNTVRRIRQRQTWTHISHLYRW